MKKLFSFMLMATALLISGNAWSAGDVTAADDAAAVAAGAVAKIGDQYYSTFALAVTDANKADNLTITLLQDEVGFAGASLSKAMTLDLNGKTLKLTAASKYLGFTAAKTYVIKNGTISDGGFKASNGLIYINKANAAVTLENVTVSSPTAVYAICANTSSTIKLDGTTSLQGATGMLQVKAGATVINNAALEGIVIVAKGKSLTYSGTGSLVLTGGYLPKGWELPTGVSIADGKIGVNTWNATYGECLQIAAGTDVVAKIGNYEYAAVSTAITAATTANPGGQEVVLQKAADLTAAATMVAGSTLDLNGNELTYIGKISLTCSTENGVYTIKNGTINSAGATYALYINSKAGIVVNLENVGINTPNYNFPVYLNNSDVLNIDEDCVLNGKTYSIGVNGASPTITNYATLTQNLYVTGVPSLSINNYGVIPGIYLSADNTKNHTIKNYAGGQFTFKVSNKSFTTGQVTLDNEGTMDVQKIASNMVITGNGTFKLVKGSYVNIDLPAATYVDLAEGTIIAATDKEDVGAAPDGLKWVDILYNNIAACQLVDENAEPVCQIGTNKYYSLADAFAAVPANDVPTTIEMIADEDFPICDKTPLVINKSQNIILDLNGHILSGANPNDKSSVHLMTVNGTLTIQDSEDPTAKGLGGKISYSGGTGVGNYANTIDIGNGGSLRVLSGRIELIEDGWYTINLNPGSECTIEGGYIYAVTECFRTFANSKTNPIILNIKGGIMEAAGGDIVFAQDPNKTQSGLQTINIVNGTFLNGGSCEYVVRVYTTGPDNLEGTTVNVSGGNAETMSALMIQHVTTNPEEDMDKVAENLATHYPQVFGFTGGTFENEDYVIKTTITKKKEGSDSYETVKELNESPSILPTLIDGMQYRDSLHADGTKTITIVPLWAADIEPVGGVYNDVKEPYKGLTIAEDATITGVDSVYSLLIKSGADVIVKNGAVLNVGDGGVTVENGGKIIVEAGGILKVGAYGFEGTGADALVVYSNPTASGIVAISPMAYLHNTPALKINLTSGAWCDKAEGEDYYWQFFAIPTNDDCHLWTDVTKVPNTWMKSWNTMSQEWEYTTNPHDFKVPFKGYVMTNDVPNKEDAVYTMNGNLVGREDATLTLIGDGSEENWNLLGNSYLAPIDVEALLDDIKADGIAKYVYAYNSTTGTYKFNNGATKEFTSIPPMNAFFMNYTGSGEAAFTIDYSKTVWGHENTNPMMAPARKAIKSNVMNISVSAGKWSDNFYLMASNDKQYDVIKMKNDYLNLYTTIDNHDYAMYVNENLDGLFLSIDACKQVEYTMTFSNTDGYTLIDHANGARVAMTDGATYTFVATPNSTDANRFEIRKITNVVTGNEDAVVDGRKDGTYLVNDQLVIVKDGKAFNVLGL